MQYLAELGHFHASRACMKGRPDEEAVLCTAAATYDLKHVETTNALLLVTPQQVRRLYLRHSNTEWSAHACRPAIRYRMKHPRHDLRAGTPAWDIRLPSPSERTCQHAKFGGPILAELNG